MGLINVDLPVALLWLRRPLARWLHGLTTGVWFSASTLFDDATTAAIRRGTVPTCPYCHTVCSAFDVTRALPLPPSPLLPSSSASAPSAPPRGEGVELTRV